MNMKTELSKKNPYWIPKEQYLELVHFCKQVPRFKTERADLISLRCTCPDSAWVISEPGDPVFNAVARIERLSAKIKMVEDAVHEAAPDIYEYLLLGVTHGYGYGYLSVKLGMPMGKDAYYDRYRKFFYILAQKR